MKDHREYTKCISDNGNPLFDTSERHDIDEAADDAESAGKSKASALKPNSSFARRPPAQYF